MRVLVAEDDEVTAELLFHALAGFGYEACAVHNGREALEHLRSGQFRMLVSDWQMPELDGIELCRRIRRHPLSSYTYIILLTAHGDISSVVQGLNAGADDYIIKPFQPEELRVRLRAGERILALDGRDLTIFALAKLAESRDPETGAHVERIREYSRVLAEALAANPKFAKQVDGEFVQLLYLTSPLHDIGKVGIPDSVLRKPGRLDDAEFRVMQQHASLGGQTLDAALVAHPDAQFLVMAREIAWTHHERFDGSGYPRGIAGEEIPLAGRIVAVADVYDALTTRRVYKPAFTHEESRAILLQGKGTQFDPDVIDAFMASEQKIVELKRRLADPCPDAQPGAAGIATPLNRPLAPTIASV